MSLCKHCISGVTHEGDAQGKWEKLDGVDCYIATPTVDYPKDKAVLMLPDVFGPKLINNQLIADDFARNGFFTVLPDYFNGDPIPQDALGSNSNFDFMAWLSKHGQEQTRPSLDKVIKVLKERGIKEFGATGYCFGARYVFDLAFENIIKVSAASHPSLLQIPADFETYIAKSSAPLLLNTCLVDQQFPPESQSKADALMGGDKFKPAYKRVFFGDCTHGFAVRGDMSNPKVKAGKEGAFKETAEWFMAHL